MTVSLNTVTSQTLFGNSILSQRNVTEEFQTGAPIYLPNYYTLKIRKISRSSAELYHVSA